MNAVRIASRLTAALTAAGLLHAVSAQPLSIPTFGGPTTPDHAEHPPAVQRLYDIAARLQTESWVTQLTARSANTDPDAHPGTLPSIRIVHAGPTHPEAGTIRVEFPHLALDATPGQLLAWHPRNTTEVFIQAEPDATPIESIASVLPPFFCPPLALAQSADPARLPLLNAPETPRVESWFTPDPDAEAFVIELTGTLTPRDATGPAAVRVTLDDVSIISYALLDAENQPIITLDVRTLFADIGLPPAPNIELASRVGTIEQLGPLREPLAVGRPLPPVPYVGLFHDKPETPASPRDAFEPANIGDPTPSAVLLLCLETAAATDETSERINAAITEARRLVARASTAASSPPQRRPRFIARPLLVIDQAADPIAAPGTALQQWGPTPADAYLEATEQRLPSLYWTPAVRDFADVTDAALILAPDGTVTAVIPLATASGRDLASSIARAVAPDLFKPVTPRILP